MIGENKETTFVFEFKWKELSYAQAKQILADLKEKTKHVPKLSKNYELGIVAKKISEKHILKKEGFQAFDLEDF